MDNISFPLLLKLKNVGKVPTWDLISSLLTTLESLAQSLEHVPFQASVPRFLLLRKSDLIVFTLKQLHNKKTTVDFETCHFAVSDMVSRNQTVAPRGSVSFRGGTVLVCPYNSSPFGKVGNPQKV